MDVTYVIKQFEVYRQSKKDLREVIKQIEYINNEMEGLKSAPLDGVPVHSNRNGKSPHWYNLSDKKDRLNIQLKTLKSTIYLCDYILKNINETDRNFLDDLYCKNMSRSAIERKYGYSNNYTYEKVERILTKYLKFM